MQNELFGSKISSIFKGSALGEGIMNLFDDKDTRTVAMEKLSDLLLGCDLGVEATKVVIGEVKDMLEVDPTLTAVDLKRSVRGSLISILTPSDTTEGMLFSKGSGPTVWFVMGANGMGKTTTIGKLSNLLRQQGKVAGEDYKVR